MIFVTVGTHEQQFDRLVSCLDEMVENKLIEEEVIIQYGYCKYIPKFCKAEKFFSYEQMKNMINDARIIITHGGPSSFIMALQANKIPIVFPREKKYNEHVNNHQVEFCRFVEEKLNNIIVVTTPQELQQSVINFDNLLLNRKNNIKFNNDEFLEKFNEIVSDLVKNK